MSLNNRNLPVSFNLNLAILRRRRNQRQVHRYRRRLIRLYRRRATNTLNRIAQLPLQITNAPFANQFFNGSPFP